MADADIFSLFLGTPDAAQQAQAQAEALRRRRENASLARNAGNVALLSGDRVLSAFGNAQLRQAGEGDAEAGRMEGLIAQAGSQGAGRALQEALAQRQQAFQAGQGALNRAAQRDIAGLTDARERDKMAAENERARLKGEADKAKGLRDATESFRKEFNTQQEVKDFRIIAPAYATLKDAVKGETGPDGVTTIFSFMNMLDPGVSVMGGDVELIRNSGGPAAKWVNWLEYAKTGQPLPPGVRKEIAARAEKMFGTRKAAYDRVGNYYSGLARKNNVAPEDVVEAIGGEDAPATPAPAGVGGFSIDTPQQSTPNFTPGGAPPPIPPDETPQAALSPADEKALDWARKHPNDERAKAVFKKLGVR